MQFSWAKLLNQINFNLTSQPLKIKWEKHSHMHTVKQVIGRQDAVMFTSTDDD